MICPQTVEVGAYVLGALSPAERDAFERHLSTCVHCRDEVSDLAVLPGLLGKLDIETARAVARDGEEYWALPLMAELPDDPSAWAQPRDVWNGPGADDPQADGPPDRWGADPFRQAGPGRGSEPARGGGSAPGGLGRGAGQRGADAPRAGDRRAGAGERRSGGPVRPDSVVSLIDAAAKRRVRARRRTWLTTAAVGVAAACLAVAVGLGIPGLLPGGRSDGGRPDGPAMTAMKQVSTSVPVTAELALQSVDKGTRVTMRCAYSGAASGYASERWNLQLMLVPRNGGAPQQAGTWTAGYGDEFQLTTVSAMPKDQIGRVELHRADGAVLLSLDL